MITFVPGLPTPLAPVPAVGWQRGSLAMLQVELLSSASDSHVVPPTACRVMATMAAAGPGCSSAEATTSVSVVLRIWSERAREVLFDWFFMASTVGER